VLRRSSSRESEAERQLLSKRASLPPMALERLAPRGGQRRGEGPSAPAPGPEEDCADYAVMSRSTSRESFASSASSSCTQRDSGVVSGSSAGGGYLDVAGGAELYRGGEGGVATPASPHPPPGVDNGYMSMLPGGGSQPPGGPPLAASFPDGGELSARGPADDYRTNNNCRINNHWRINHHYWINNWWINNHSRHYHHWKFNHHYWINNWWINNNWRIHNNWSIIINNTRYNN
jgi:hypothetical protein